MPVASRVQRHRRLSKNKEALPARECARGGAPGMLHGERAVLALILVWLDAAIAAPPRHECRPSAFPGSHRHGGAMLRMDARGPPAFSASCRRHASSMTTDDHRATLRPRLTRAGPSPAKSASARLHPGSSKWAGGSLCEAVRPGIRLHRPTLVIPGLRHNWHWIPDHHRWRSAVRDDRGARLPS